MKFLWGGRVRDVTLTVSGPRATVEVDGELDLVVLHDMRLAMEAALRQNCREIWLDLSHVQRVDPDCSDALSRHLEHVSHQGAHLRLVALSAPIEHLSSPGGPLSGISRGRRDGAG